MRLHSPDLLSAGEIIAWAYEAGSVLPENANTNIWNLMIEDWRFDARQYCQFAADPACPKRHYFLAVLRNRLRESTRGTALAMAAKPTARLKGRGRKEKLNREKRLANAIARESEARVAVEARALIDCARAFAHPDLQQLVRALERFIEDKESISDEYWQCRPSDFLFQ